MAPAGKAIGQRARQAKPILFVAFNERASRQLGEDNGIGFIGKLYLRF
jgi:hypothetical protein